MPDRIPRNFRESQERSIASFSFVDIASGTGFVTFYPGTTVDKKVMSSNKFYSDEITQDSGSVSHATFTKVADIDYDVLFNKPQVVTGEGILTVPIGMLSKQSGNRTYQTYIIAKVRHWDGTTETDLVTNQSRQMDLDSTGVDQYKYGIVAIDLTIPETVFAVGDTLRLTIEQWAHEAIGGDAGHYFYGQDPNSRATGDDETITWGTEPSLTEFQVPFRIDL
tara:strand:+ start:154 stop:819 length:666 start_codon:yes stop_codon:yes gene_type:complete